MDIQRTILWVIFGMSLLFLWDAWQKQQGRPSMLSPAATAPAPAASDKAAAPPAGTTAAATGAATGAVPAGAQSAAVPAAAQPPGASVGGLPAASAPRNERVQVQTDRFRVEFDPTGAVVARAELLQQDVAPDWTASGLLGLITGKRHDPEKNVVLLEWNSNRVYLARTGITSTTGARFPNHLTPFEPLPGPRTMEPGQDTLEVKFAAEAGGLRVVKTYIFRRGSYAIEVRHELQNLGNEPITPSVYLQLVRDGNKPEGESALYYTFTGPAVYTDARKFQKINFSDIEKKKAEHANEAKDGWIAMIQHYFVTAWLPPQGQLREFRTSVDGPNLFSVSTVMPLPQIAPGASATSTASLWIGPQDQKSLVELAPGLDLVVDYGWLTMISKPLFWLLQVLHGVTGNWGWAIVLLTVLIKAAFYPLSAASYRSMAKMKEVTPRLMKLREQYGDDKQKMNMAMMELYKNEKINPLGGCLPILVQIPVFIALYWVLLASVEMRNQPWVLWVQDLATPDPWFILPIIMIASMWVQYKLNPTPPDPIQAKVMAAMPFIFGVMFFFFPAGLVLYWVVNNLLSIAQQWYVTKQIQKAKPVG
ncbi:MAG: membrane protein insertase YidC [Burkholderiales bacterium]|nr:membrane protein insertase YidC [Burkholderiales bacterium]